MATLNNNQTKTTTRRKTNIEPKPKPIATINGVTRRDVYQT